MSGDRRVAVTGLGVVAPAGIGVDAFWSGLLGPGISDGRQSVEIEDWDPTPYFENPKHARRADRVEQFALAAAGEAFDRAGGVDAIGVDPGRFGTIFASGIGGLRTLEEQVIVRVEKGERRVSPFLVPMMMVNASGAAISMRYGLQGPNETICTACAAGTHAIGYAARLIKWGVIDAAATGGGESAATITALAGFRNMTALSTVGHQPSLRRRPRRLRDGRGLGRAHPRGVVAGRGARRGHPRRDPRQREQCRRASHHRPLAGRRGRDHLHATRAGRLGDRGRARSNRSTRTARRRHSTTPRRRPR